jgi:hypothetical protein
LTSKTRGLRASACLDQSINFLNKFNMLRWMRETLSHTDRHARDLPRGAAAARIAHHRHADPAMCWGAMLAIVGMPGWRIITPGFVALCLP